VADGSPAVTVNRHGSGRAWYVGTELDDPTFAALVDDVFAERDVRPTVAGLGPGVEALRRTGPAGSWLFVVNHTDRVAVVPIDGYEMLSGVEIDDELSVPAGGVAVVRERESGA
jgi:beta-galactosidase